MDPDDPIGLAGVPGKGSSDGLYLMINHATAVLPTSRLVPLRACGFGSLCPMKAFLSDSSLPLDP